MSYIGDGTLIETRKSFLFPVYLHTQAECGFIHYTQYNCILMVPLIPEGVKFSN